MAHGTQTLALEEVGVGAASRRSVTLQEMLRHSASLERRHWYTKITLLLGTELTILRKRHGRFEQSILEWVMIIRPPSRLSYFYCKALDSLESPSNLWLHYHH